MRILERRFVGDRCGVEDDDVGKVAGAQNPALTKLEARGRLPGHLVHGGLERKQRQVARVAAENAGECPVSARMRRRRVAIPSQPPVRADHRLRVLHDPLHVRFIENVINHAGAALQLSRDHQLSAVLGRWSQTALFRPVRERLAVELRLPAHVRELNAGDVSTAAIGEQELDDSLLDAVAQHRILEPSDERRVAAVVCPGGNQNAKSRGCRRVGIHVYHYVESDPSCRIDHCERADALAPHLLADGFVVREHDGDPRVARDGDRLGHAFDETESFLAQVRRVDAAGVGGNSRERDHFLDLREVARQVSKSGRYAERAVAHAFRDQRLHALQLIRRWRATDGPHHTLLYGVVADEVSDVDADPALRERVHVRTERKRRTAVGTAEGECYSLSCRALCPEQLEQWIDVRVHINEAGRHDLSRCINDSGPSGRGNGSAGNERNAIAFQRHVGAKPRGAGAVDDRAAAYDDVELGLLRANGACQQGREGRAPHRNHWHTRKIDG